MSNNQNKEIEHALRPLPEVYLPGPGRSISDFATFMAENLCKEDIFLRSGKVVEAVWGNGNDPQFQEIQANRFRTWSEDYVRTLQKGQFGPFVLTMSKDLAQAVLDSPQFQKRLRVVDQLCCNGLPGYDEKGALRFIPAGYDSLTQSFVFGPSNYLDEISSVPEAKAFLLNLYEEFVFDDKDGRSLSVALASLLTPFVRLLHPPAATFPAFAFSANSVGAGKGTCLKIALLANFGTMDASPVGASSEELKKKLGSALMRGAPYLWLDNIKDHISSPALEAYCTAGRVSERVLGKSQDVVGRPPLVFMTGNDLSLGEDMQSRTLVVELFMKEERAEERDFRVDFDEEHILNNRGKILASLWKLVEAWDQAGRPKCQGKSRHKSWLKIVPAILAYHDLGDPTARPCLQSGVSSEADDLRGLRAGMVRGKQYTTPEVVDLCHELGLFDLLLVGWEGNETTETKLRNSIKQKLAAVLKRGSRKTSTDGLKLERCGTGKSRTWMVTSPAAAASDGSGGVDGVVFESPVSVGSLPF